MSWTWEQKLKNCEGKVVVTAGEFYLYSYFPGPDLRYSGTLLKISDKDLSRYMTALLNAWYEYERLVAVVPFGAEIKSKVKMDVEIHISRWPGRGITMCQHYGLISTREKLDDLLSELSGLEMLALKVRTVLSSIQD